MIRATIIAALAAALLGLWWFADRQHTRALQAEAALAGAQARLAQVAEASAVHRAHLDRMARQQAAYDALATEFDHMEGGDAPLSDYLRSVDGRLH
jgi:hypothetical protein